MDNETLILRDLSPDQQLLFMSEMVGRRKSETTGLMLCLFLGGLGAHRFYLGQTGLGVLYALFVFTFVPTIISLFECFVIQSRVRDYNNRMNTEAALKVRVIRPATQTGP